MNRGEEQENGPLQQNYPLTGRTKRSSAAQHSHENDKPKWHAVISNISTVKGVSSKS